MKRFVLAAAIALMVIGTASAQGWGPGGAQGWNGASGWGGAQADLQKMEGTLELQNGFIVLASGGTAYHVPGIQRLVGFVPEIREGARVSVEGYAYGNIFQATGLTIGGRTHDLSSGFQQQGGYGPMMGGYGPMMGGGFCW